MHHENYDPSFPDQPAVDLYLPIWAHLPAFSHKPAFVWADDGPGSTSCLTYEQLNSAVDTISSHLLFSLQKGDVVAILCEPGLELVPIIFACQRAGLIALPITPPNLSSPDNQHHHLVRAFSQTKPKAALAAEAYIRHAREYAFSTANRLSNLLSNVEWIAIEELKVSSRRNSDISAYAGCRASDVYLIQYTSGATGIPKPVVVTAGAAAHNVRAARGAYDLHPNSVIVSWLPQYHDCGLMFLMLTVVCGATCVLTSPAAFVTRPRFWLEMITNHKATCTPVPSFALPLTVRRGGGGSAPIKLSTLKNLIIINEPIHKAPMEEFLRFFAPFGLDPSSLSPSYGLAENCTFVSTAWRRGGTADAACFPVFMNLLPSAKLPTSMAEEDIEIIIVNQESNEAVEDGVEGEIWVASPSNAVGYLGHPSLTNDVFNARLRGNISGRYVRTGDRGVVAGEGRYLYVTGRCSDVISCSNNVQIHAHYVEAAAYGAAPEKLRAGCAAAFEHRGVVAMVAELVRSDIGRNELMGLCERIRGEVAVEVGIGLAAVVLGGRRSVAKTTSGKVQRWAVKYAYERGELKEVVRMEFGKDGSCMAVVFGGRMHGDKKIKKERYAEKRLSLISSL